MIHTKTYVYVYIVLPRPYTETTTPTEKKVYPTCVRAYHIQIRRTWYVNIITYLKVRVRSTGCTFVYCYFSLTNNLSSLNLKKTFVNNIQKYIDFVLTIIR